MEQYQHKAKHLEIVQEIVKRQAQNSFIIKGWSITLITLVFTIIITQGLNPQLSLFSLIPTLAFWYLDAYYVRQERLFRKLYEDIADDITGDESNVKLYDLDIKIYENVVPHTWKTMLSETVLLLPILSMCLAVLVSLILLDKS